MHKGDTPKGKCDRKMMSGKKDRRRRKAILVVRKGGKRKVARSGILLGVTERRLEASLVFRDKEEPVKKGNGTQNPINRRNSSERKSGGVLKKRKRRPARRDKCVELGSGVPSPPQKKLRKRFTKTKSVKT